MEFFEEVAKFRVAREIYAKIMKDSFHANNAKSQFRPDILTDYGGDLHIAHELRTTRFYGGTEESTTGVKRLEILQSRKGLKYPVIAVNNAYTKQLFDNRLACLYRGNK